MGDIIDKNTVKFLNETICPFKIIKVEIKEKISDYIKKDY